MKANLGWGWRAFKILLGFLLKQFNLKTFAHIEMRDLSGEEEVVRNPVFL